MEGGAAKLRDSGLASDMKQPKEEAAVGALQADAAEPHAVAQNPEEDKGAVVGAAKLAVPAAYHENNRANPVAPGGESHKQSELGARGVPLRKEIPVDHQPAPQNDQIAQMKDEESNLHKEKLRRDQLEKERMEKEQLEADLKEKIAREQEMHNEQAEKIDKELQARLEREQLERERQDKLAREREEIANKERVDREVRARVEKERLDRERREKLERERAAQEKLAQEKAAEERRQQEKQKADNEVLERVRKEKEVEEVRERLAQLEQAGEAKNAGNAVQGAQREDNEALKKGGRDLKVNVAAQADPREGVEDWAIKAEAHPQGSHEKMRDQGEMDLRRRRRALGPKEDEGPPEKPRVPRGVHRLEPLLELGGPDLHVALEEQLLAGAMVHSRQIKQTSEDKEVK